LIIYFKCVQDEISYLLPIKPQILAIFEIQKMTAARTALCALPYRNELKDSDLILPKAREVDSLFNLPYNSLSKNCSF
jgi:hypothetical protein